MTMPRVHGVKLYLVLAVQLSATIRRIPCPTSPACNGFMWPKYYTVLV